jgi:hypothetical protein
MRNNPLFSTPRKLDVDDFASSGGETPKSPERNDIDSDATPDMSLRSKFSTLDNMSKPVFTAGGKKEKDRESPSRRQSWWKGIKDMASSPRSKDEYAHGAERKIMKKRTKEQKAMVARRDSVSDSETEQRPIQVTKSRKVSAKQDKSLDKPAPSQEVQQEQQQHQQQHQQQPPSKHWSVTLFEFITAHPTLPHVLSFYAQLLLNMFLIGSIMSSSTASGPPSAATSTNRRASP